MMIRAFFPLILFSALTLSTALVYGADDDFLSRFGDYKVKTIFGSIKKPTWTHQTPDASTEKLRDLPLNSFLKKTDEKTVEGRPWVKVEYTMITDHQDCNGILRDPALKTTLSNSLQGYMKGQMTENKFYNSVIKSVVDKNYDKLCIKHGWGWVEKDLLEDNGKTKTEAKIMDSVQCGDCKSLDAPEPSVSKLDKFKKELMDSIPKSDTCGPPGKPYVEKFGTVTMAFEYRMSEKLVAVQKVNKKGVTYRGWEKKQSWQCGVKYIEGCGPEKNKNADLTNEVAIADKFHSDSRRCTTALETYYKACSNWKGLSNDERIEKVQGITTDVTQFLHDTKDDFPSEIEPELLQCIARRENHDFEPLRLNYQACAPRTGAQSRMGDEFMKGWKSSAYGFSMHVFKTIKDYWPWLKDEKAFGQTNKTFEQAFGGPENFFKNYLSKDPHLGIQVMALHLEHLMDLYKDKKNPRFFDKAILSYDGDKAKTYLPAVKGCVKCLTNDPEGYDYECFNKLHPGGKKKK